MNYLLVPLVKDFGFLRIFNYISFRAAGAAVTALVMSFIIGPLIIERLRRMRLHQIVREGTPASHQDKRHTPTMGGLIILSCTLIPTLLWSKLNNKYVLIAMFVMLWMGFIGFFDDFLKLKQRQAGAKNTGLIESYKLMGQLSIGIALGWYLWHFPLSTLPGASTTLPFYKYILDRPQRRVALRAVRDVRARRYEQRCEHHRRTRWSRRRSHCDRRFDPRAFCIRDRPHRRVGLSAGVLSSRRG